MVRLRATFVTVATLLSTRATHSKDADTADTFFVDDERIASLTRASYIR